MTDLSVIIVCHNGWKRLLNCLNSLNSFTGDQFSTEVIIVDNSSDETIYEIESNYPEFRFIHNRINGGFANGCNLGAENAAGEFLLFLNPDTIASEEEIGKLLFAARQNPSCNIVSCRQVNENGKENRTTGQFPDIWNLTGFQRTVALIFKARKTNDSLNEILYPDWVSGSVMMLKRELFKEINGFDEDFWMYFEDVDICRRIRNAGGRTALFRNITIEHNHGGSSRTNLRVTSITKTEVLISKHVYVSKHFTGPEQFLAQLVLILQHLVSGFIQSLFGTIFFFIPELFVKTSVFLRLLKYYTGVISRLTWISPKAIMVQKSKQV